MAHESASSKTGSVLLSLLTLTTVLCAIATAQSNNSDCTNVVLSMSPCLNYVSSNSSVPSTACCTQLGTVVTSQPQCLCQVLNGGGSNLGLTIDQNQAMELPKACNVETPPVSQCKVDSQTGSPGSGSRTGPSSGNNSSDSYSNKFFSFSQTLLCFGLLSLLYLIV